MTAPTRTSTLEVAATPLLALPVTVSREGQRPVCHRRGEDRAARGCGRSFRIGHSRARGRRPFILDVVAPGIVEAVLRPIDPEGDAVAQGHLDSALRPRPSRPA